MSIPMSLASYLMKIKIFVFEPNSILGRANNLTLSLQKKLFVMIEI